MKKIWREKKRALRALDYFDFLSDDEIQNTAKLCSLRQFNPLDTIFAQDKGSLTNVHFVLSGECVIMQYLNLKVTERNGKQIYKLAEDQFSFPNLSTTKEEENSDNLLNLSKESDNNENDQKVDYFKSHFIDVGSIRFGGIFGLGETCENRVIIARTTVQCLTLPRCHLMDKELNPGNIWQRRLLYLNCIIPSREMLFENFVKTLKWKEFRKNFINETVPKIASAVATIDDIPILCRIEENLNN